jgi:sugar phosphate isomerase/epimerase
MRLAVSSWSYRGPLYAGRMHVADVPRAVAALGISGMEANDLFFWVPPPGLLGRLRIMGKPLPRVAPDYRRAVLRPLRNALVRAGVELVALALTTDLAGALAAPRAQLDYLGTALAAARELDTSLLRVVPGGPERPAAAQIDGVGKLLRTMMAAARAMKVRLAVENDGGMATDPEALVALVETAGKDLVGVCLDLGNFPEGQGPAGIRRLAPYAVHVHAKARVFAANGEETSIDYAGALGALKDAGYDGAISIEYEGDLAPEEGIGKTRALIEKYW